ncbi:MAG: ABC transporter permease [Atopobiaceae bacterium]|nr:ABC transporter permease [Atopobiaceae bacterium]
MKPSDLVHETWSALSANRGRSALTILGIVIGIAAVITMNSIIAGISVQQSQMFGANAARLVAIRLSGIDNFTVDDMNEIAQSVPGYDYLIPTVQGTGNISTNAKKASADVTGTDPRYLSAHSTKLVAGDFFDERDMEEADRVLIMDEPGVKKLFGKKPPTEVVGESVHLGNDEYLIKGVVDKVNSWSTWGDTVYCMAPYPTVSIRLTGTTSIKQMECMTSEGSDIDTVMAATKQYLNEHYHLASSDEEDGSGGGGSPRSVSVTSDKSILDQVNQSMASFQAIMVIVSGISLLVGGIGIMNMMLTNVTERIREIGLRKALGAKRFDITSQFILESVCLCIAGGIIGVILGIGGAYVLAGPMGESMGMSSAGDPLTPVIDGASILNAVLVCTVTGLIFGWYPARSAARLDPVESLNHQ